MTSVTRRPALAFGISAMAVIAACLVVLRSQMFAAHPDVAAWGMTFDLTITIPLLYWFFVVRAGRASAITIAPVFVLCTLIAAAIIPRAQQHFVRDLGRFAVPLAEIALIGVVVHRLRKGRIDSRVVEIVRSELLMLYYAFAGWRKKPAAVDGRAI